MTNSTTQQEALAAHLSLTPCQIVAVGDTFKSGDGEYIVVGYDQAGDMALSKADDHIKQLLANTELPDILRNHINTDDAGCSLTETKGKGYWLAEYDNQEHIVEDWHIYRVA
jgi:hypothetical protein